jgi:hypothetical protein
LQKLGPIQADLVIIKDDIVAVKPILDLLDIFYRNRVDPHIVLVILMNQSQIKVSYISSHPLEPNYLNIFDCEDEEMRFCDIDDARFSRLEEDIRSKSCSIESQISLWKLKFEFSVGKLLTRFCPR